MAPDGTRHSKPAIRMARSDHERLSRLAESYSTRNPEVADQLLAELDRARVVDDKRVAGDVVRMGSRLRFTTDAGEDRTVTLVFPGEADIAEGKVSILTPIGAALIGLSSGQSIDWTARDGRVHRLTVESVEPAAPDNPGNGYQELRSA
ncbi:nucleoside diphosphate kinase regulator [Mesorhizobium sp. LHD-90]|uniref:nucleoside diphosphate kinase regulator n=1 Tax=Mesorhizobium sp. LHD-90 TaxID=3071414 RepID=UPI0027DF8315|nr:nucleoside diphosphate kinase regulator [Mesorhizobium sp. LHD-90]MDQ6438031.1 nucleoside diphosphate kinase regulator [Mesorhizobium sp. LHD-90]